MLRVLCFGDSNTWGSATVPRPDERYFADERWPGVAQADLGPQWRLIEEGLPGRTTVHDDPTEGAYMNGSTYLLPCLRSHRPLDAVVIMLGTNDLKAKFSVPAYEIGSGIGVLLGIVERSEAGRGAGVPRTLVVCPPPLLTHTGAFPDYAEMLEGGYDKSLKLRPHYERVAKEAGAAFLAAGDHVVTSAYDGIHFDPDQQQKLGTAIAAALRPLLAGVPNDARA